MSTDIAHPKSQAVLETTQHPVLTATTGSGRMQCMVICPDASRRHELAEHTGETGWITYESADLESANELRRRLMMHLAVVDFCGLSVGQGAAMRQLVTTLSHERDMLLVVCGHGCADEEIWARQLGVWIYLPGLIDPADLSPIFSEARDLAERLIATRGSPLGGSATWAH